MSADTWVRWGSKFIESAMRETSLPNPSGYVAVNNAWTGLEDSLKGVLVKGGVTWDNREGHNLRYLVKLIDSNRLADKPQVAQLVTSVEVVTRSGSVTNFKYPEKDPLFFESLSKPDIVNRTDNAKNGYDICNSIVSGP